MENCKHEKVAHREELDQTTGWIKKYDQCLKCGRRLPQKEL